MSLNPVPAYFRTHATEINTDPKSAGERVKLQFEQFIDILVSELKNQDPTNPVDNSDFLSQLATLQNLESMATLTEGIETFMKFQQVSAASGLIGHSVSFFDADTGVAVTGMVDKVVFESGNVLLSVEGRDVAFENVREIL